MKTIQIGLGILTMTDSDRQQRTLSDFDGVQKTFDDYKGNQVAAQ